MEPAAPEQSQFEGFLYDINLENIDDGYLNYYEIHSKKWKFEMNQDCRLPIMIMTLFSQIQ